MRQPPTFTEPHNTRMVRKFGSLERFNAVKKSHGLIPRGKEVGLDISMGFHQPQLDKRIQSNTMNSHRLVLYVAETHGLEACEALYDELNRRHFTEAAVLNDKEMLLEALFTALPQLTNAQKTSSVAFLNDTNAKGSNAVLQMYERVQKLGVYSIPTLIVDGTYMVSGAERSGAIFDVFVKAAANGITGQRLFGDISVLSEPKEEDLAQ